MLCSHVAGGSAMHGVHAAFVLNSVYSCIHSSITGVLLVWYWCIMVVLLVYYVGVTLGMRTLTLSNEEPQVYLPPAPPFFVLPVPFLDCEDLQPSCINKVPSWLTTM